MRAIDIKILHISHSGLPDARIEKMALLGKMLGHETIYVGTEKIGTTLGIFDAVYHVKQSPYMHIGVPTTRSQQKKIRNLISKINPDIVHLHNILMYEIVTRTGYPFILDDHEYLSKEVYYDSGRRLGIPRKIIFPFQLSTWRRRQRHAANNVPIVTVSEPIANYYRGLGGDAEVIPNYPSEYELTRAEFSKKVDDITSVYQGTTNLVDVCSYRNSTGFVEFFKKINKPLVCVGNTEHSAGGRVSFTGYIPHMQLFTEMSKYHIGIIPWRRHPFHKYCCPNKVYFYAHCGMVVIVTSEFESVIRRFEGRCRVVKRYEGLQPILEVMENYKDSTIAEAESNRIFARKNFIFEHYKDTLKEAYKNA